MKKNLKLYVYKQSKHVNVRRRTFCRTGQRVTLCSKVKVLSTGAEAKASLKRATKLYGVDPKPGDLSMSRLKQK